MDAHWPGTALLKALVIRAREVGVIRFTGLIHADNDAIRRLVEKVAGAYEARWAGQGAVEVAFDLPTGGGLPPSADREESLGRSRSHSGVKQASSFSRRKSSVRARSG